MNAAQASFEAARKGQLQRGGPFASEDRLEAWGRFVALGLPGPREEKWKYTPLAALQERTFTPAPRPDLTRLALPDPIADAARVVFVNGRFTRALGRPSPTSGALAVVSSRARAPRPPTEDALGALNRALFEEAVQVEVPAGEDGGRLELLHVATQVPDGAMVHPRALFKLGEGARLTVVERFWGASDAAYLVNAVGEATLGKGAHLVHALVQSEGPAAVHLFGLRARLGEASRLDGHVLALGGALAREEVEIHFEGPGGFASVDGLSLSGSGQHQDLHVRVEHAQPGCTSRQRWRGLLFGTGRAVSTGRVHVHPDAQKTDAAQSARALLLSRDAEADLRPHLEIHADDVKAAHGATVGELDPDQLFYLRARGIPEPLARSMLTVAFARELLDAFPEPVLQARALAELEARSGLRLEGGR